MIDINLIRSKPKEIEEALRKRNQAIDFSDVLKWDEERRRIITESDSLKTTRNQTSNQVPKLRKAGKSIVNLLNEMKKIAQQIKKLDNKSTILSQKIQSTLEQLPNIPDPDVPAGGKEKNKVVREWGTKPDKDFKLSSHIDLAKKLELIDFERGAKISGSGFWLYTGNGALLELALINYFISRNVSAGYEMILVPHIVNWECGYVSGQLPKFGDDIYQLASGTDTTSGSGRQMLIPTAETALSAIHQNEILDSESLPLKYCAFSPCYRREAGSYRTHDRGTIRGHQFNKVDLFQFVDPDKSDAALDELVQHAESLVKDLGLHYRVSKLAAGDCSAASSKTYDIEVWIPSMQSYEEVSSASNTRDYQSRRSRTRVRKSSKLNLAHTLNASGLATSRLLPAVIESWQQADGSVIIPSALKPFINTNTISNNKYKPQ